MQIHTKEKHSERAQSAISTLAKVAKNIASDLFPVISFGDAFFMCR